MSLILKVDGDPFWLEPQASSYAETVIRLRGDGADVPGHPVDVPAVLLLAVSPLLRSILSADHLPPAYQQPAISLPSVTCQALQTVRELFVSGEVSVDKSANVTEIQSVFKMLGIEIELICDQPQVVKMENEKVEEYFEYIKTEDEFPNVKKHNTLKSLDIVKVEPEILELQRLSPKEKKIIRQIEYYFGDFNLPRDKFLNEKTKYNQGWVRLKTMLTFRRLAEISTDVAEIAAAIKKSKAGLIAVSEDNSKIRRDPAIPLPENTDESRKLLEARTVYAKGFDKENTTLDELLDHFNKTNPNVVSIQMRKRADIKGKKKVWHFKGSVFISFKTEEGAKEFVDNKGFKYKDFPLVIKFQKNYFEEKAKDKDKEARKKRKRNRIILKLTGLGGEISREDIKDMLKHKFSVNTDKIGGDIAFVDYERGAAEAKIRFKAKNYAKSIAEKWVRMKKVKIQGATIVGSLLEGKEEEKFLAKSQLDLKHTGNKTHSGHKRSGGGHHSHGGKKDRC